MNSSKDGQVYEDMRRVKRERIEARDHYDRISKYYCYLEDAFGKRYRLLGLDLLGIEEGERILEIGFGTGQALVKIAERVGLEGKTIGIDISYQMAKISRNRLKENDLFENVELVCGDGINLPFKDDHFDRVFLSFTLELFDSPEIASVLDEVRYVLKPDGKLGVVSLAKEKELSVYLYEIFHDLFPKMIDCRPLWVERILEKERFKIEVVKKERIGTLPIKLIRARPS